MVLAVLTAGWSLGILRSHSGYNVDANGFMLRGFDPVSYFPEGGGTPARGDSRWTAEVDGRKYRFASDGSRAAFQKNPSRYEPQYAGWCAYAVANGYKFDADPESYLVHDGRLLLFYKGVLGDARAEFQKAGVGEGVADADRNWPALAAE